MSNSKQVLIRVPEEKRDVFNRHFKLTAGARAISFMVLEGLVRSGGITPGDCITPGMDRSADGGVQTFPARFRLPQHCPSIHALWDELPNQLRRVAFYNAIEMLLDVLESGDTAKIRQAINAASGHGLDGSVSARSEAPESESQTAPRPEEDVAPPAAPTESPKPETAGAGAGGIGNILDDLDDLDDDPFNFDDGPDPFRP